MKKLSLAHKNILKRRNVYAQELLLSGLYKQRIIKSKKIYNRKKLNQKRLDID